MRQFEGFKKIDDSATHATFRHENGSELKVAKSGLSQKMRKQLDGLPVYRAEGDPDGNPVPEALRANSDDDSGSPSPTHPINININAGPPQQGQATNPAAAAVSPQDKEMLAKKMLGGQDQGQAMDAAQISPDIKAQMGAPTPPAAPMPSVPAGQVASADGAIPPPPGPQEQAPAPMPQPLRAPAPAPAPGSPEAHKQVAMQELTQEDQAWQHDLQNGHITPKLITTFLRKKIRSEKSELRLALS